MTSSTLSTTDLLAEPLLVAHDGRGVVGVLLLQVLQEGLPLLVHVRGLHGQDVPGAAGAPYRVPAGAGAAGGLEIGSASRRARV